MKGGLTVWVRKYSRKSVIQGSRLYCEDCEIDAGEDCEIDADDEEEKVRGRQDAGFL